MSEVQDASCFLFDTEQVGAKFRVDICGKGFCVGEGRHVVQDFLIADLGRVVDFGGVSECRDAGQQCLLQVFAEFAGEMFSAVETFNEREILRLFIHVDGSGREAVGGDV